MWRFNSMSLRIHLTYIPTLRTRLVGLAALTGVVTSEALYHSTQQLKAQVSIFMVSLFTPLLLVEVLALDDG